MNKLQNTNTQNTVLKVPMLPSGILFPFILLTSMFAFWGLANNMTDTLLPAFKRIMSMTDSKTAWIQVVCYFLGYGCMAIPGAIFIKRFTYKSGVLLGLGLFAVGGLLFYPAVFVESYNVHFFGIDSADLCFFAFLVAICIIFSGLSILETSCNPYICALGAPETATQRLNFAQSFNPLGSIMGVFLSQALIMSQLKTFSAAERAGMNSAELSAVRAPELFAVATPYVSVALILVVIWLMIFFTKMPNLSETDRRIDFFGTWKRLLKNYHYVWGVAAQFFYVGAQIACWSYINRYAQVALDLENIARTNTAQLQNVEPLAAGFNWLMNLVGFQFLVATTAEGAGNIYYIMSLLAFVTSRFICTGLMKYIKPHLMLTVLAVFAVACCFGTVYLQGSVGVYSLIGISACMSLMFPTIFGLGTYGLGEDTKMGGAGMVMAICGAALLTQMQGYLSDWSGIRMAYWVPAIAFLVIAYYGAVVCRNDDRLTNENKTVSVH
ncbi:MAG: L-fucose:H+ symporter permease [Planctomycetaceae bacterium]|jgi:FHS family L-fucose permease-like MFS transporter|nr:L-fucose:H+ symporter permease [Planctomycetaceae bacterium]